MLADPRRRALRVARMQIAGSDAAESSGLLLSNPEVLESAREEREGQALVWLLSVFGLACQRRHQHRGLTLNPLALARRKARPFTRCPAFNNGRAQRTSSALWLP